MLGAMSGSGVAWTRALLLQLLLAGLGVCLSRLELFPFGPGQGDLELEAGDDLVSLALELNGALHFYDRSDIDSVYVSATRGPNGAAGKWGDLEGISRKEEAGLDGRTDVGVVGGERGPSPEAPGEDGPTGRVPARGDALPSGLSPLRDSVT